MKRILFSILLFPSLVFSSNYSTDLCAGIALSPSRPGPYVSVGPNLCLGKYFSIGFHADYSWNTINTGSDGLHAGYHIPEAAIVPKLHMPLIANGSFFAELDPGYGLCVYYQRYNYSSRHDVTSGVSLTFGGGFEVGKFIIGFKRKIQYSAPGRSVFYVGYLGE